MSHSHSAAGFNPNLGFADGGGEMGALVRAFDWAATPLGPLSAWPQSLRTAVGMMLAARHPMYVAWGPQLILLYNDNYRQVLGAKADDPRQVLGQPLSTVWAEVWEQLEPMLAATQAGESLWHEDQPLTLTRNGYAERVYANFSTSPIRDEEGAIAGVLCVSSAPVDQVRRHVEQRLRLLDEIGEATRLAAEPKAIMEHSTRLLGEYLDVTRVAYADLEADNDRFTIRHD
jgi:hypothetical protein